MPRKKVKKQKKPYFVRFLWALIALLVVFAFGFYMQYSSVTTYTGTLPCADCSGIQTTLTIRGNHSYTLQSLYIGKGGPFTEQGVWEQTEKNNMQVYQLTSNEATSYYQIVSEGTIRMLDSQAEPINAPFNLDLKRE